MYSPAVRSKKISTGVVSGLPSMYPAFGLESCAPLLLGRRHSAGIRVAVPMRPPWVAVRKGRYHVPKLIEK
jgi:hypothetical protein